jgi:hypothetical protein
VRTIFYTAPNASRAKAFRGAYAAFNVLYVLHGRILGQKAFFFKQAKPV